LFYSCDDSVEEIDSQQSWPVSARARARVRMRTRGGRGAPYLEQRLCGFFALTSLHLQFLYLGRLRTAARLSTSGQPDL